jgi:predicted TPR repeat methyltransferase
MADQDWLRQGHTDPTDVARLYDAWADEYDGDLVSWDYRAPRLTVERLVAAQPGAGPVLDVGCGTGLVGRRLQAAGFGDVVGIDLSARSLELAEETGAYRALHRVDLQTSPVPFDDDTFAAVVCVGVMTYLPDTAAVVTEFCRVARPGGPVLFTQREDLWDERDCRAVIDELAASGTCLVEQISDPLPYLPDSELGDLPARLVHLRSGPEPQSGAP